MFGSLTMLYASHVLDGKRTLEQVPVSIREQVKEVLEEAIKKDESSN